ncbi:MAG: glycosyltransferase [Methanobrevibacter sp.]|nr:glycosyltransferase [Methanobrevibacter sp.]
MSKVSIIMPVYNDANLLDKSINSFLNQTLDNIELICVNDGSTDGSLEILNSYSEEYESVKVLTQSNQGSGKARNYGISQAQGEYIGFLDADDYFIDNDSLEKLYETAIKNDALMVTGNIKLVDDNDKFSQFIYLEYYKDYKVILPQEYGIPWAFYKNIYKTEFIQENNILFPDLLRGQDPVFLAEIMSKMDKIYTVPTDFYAYFYIDGANQCNTERKRYDHMMHYKMVFDYLSDSKFDEIRHLFRYKMISFISMMGIEGGEDILKATREIFKDESKLLNDFETAFYLKHMHDNLKDLVDLDDVKISIVSDLQADLNQTFTNYEIVNTNSLNQIKGDYIYLHNSSEKLDEDFLEAAYKNILYNDSDILIFSTDSLLKNKLKGKRTYKFTFDYEYIKDYIFELISLPKLYRKDFLIEEGLDLNNDLKAILRAKRISYQRKNYGNGPRDEMDLNEIFTTLMEFKDEISDYDGDYILNHISSDEDLFNAQKIFNQDLISSSNNFDEFKLKYKMLNLENEFNTLKNQNKNLKKQNKKLKKLNSQLLNSTSWKMTKPLRKIRNLK